MSGIRSVIVAHDTSGARTLGRANNPDAGIIVASVAFTAWSASSGVPEKVLEQIIKTLQGGGAPAQSYAPQQQHAPPPQPAPYAPQPAPAPAVGNAAVMEQLKQLGSLRDAGVLTPEEFEAKKAELLKRI